MSCHAVPLPMHGTRENLYAEIILYRDFPACKNHFRSAALPMNVTVILDQLLDIKIFLASKLVHQTIMMMMMLLIRDRKTQIYEVVNFRKFLFSPSLSLSPSLFLSLTHTHFYINI